jgi:hypothetical protein
MHQGSISIALGAAHIRCSLMLERSTHMRLQTVLAPALILACAAALADPPDPLNGSFEAAVGGFLVSTDTKVRLDGEGSRGDEIDTEEDLGLRDSDVLRLDAYWRFKPKHKIRLLYFDATRSASRVIQRTIDFGDETFDINTEVGASFKTEVLELAYEYAFWRRPKYEITGSVGLHNVAFELGLSAEGLGTSVTRAESADVTGPLPVFGVRGIWRLGERWHLDAQAQYFQLEFDKYDGRLNDYNVAVIWMPFDWVGIGAGYNDFRFSVDVDAKRYNGSLRWSYGGAKLFANIMF